MSTTDTPRTDEQINGKPCTRFAVFAGDSLRDALVRSEFARQLERELAAAQAKIANQSERIRYLEGATNHAIGTPLSQAHAKIAELEQDKARLDWIEANADQILCSESVAGNIEQYWVAATRAAIDAEMEGQP